MDKEQCEDYVNDPQWNCSSNYKDDIYQYQICPHNIDKCGDKLVRMDIEDYEDGDSSVIRQIRDLNKGETCNFRAFAQKGAPTWAVQVADKKWSSSLNHVNITYVEFEQDVVKFAGIEQEGLSAEDRIMPLTDTHYIF
jgi:hypothetical protein